MKGSNGYRRGTRNLRVKLRNRGKTKIRNCLQGISEGEKVAIKINASFHKIPHPRFHGRIGSVVGKQGRAYYVKIKEGAKEKRILVTPEHLVTLQEGK